MRLVSRPRSAARFQYLLQRQRAFFAGFAQRFPLHAFHQQVVHTILAATSYNTQRVVIQIGNGLSLPLETLASAPDRKKIDDGKEILIATCAPAEYPVRGTHPHPAGAHRRAISLRSELLPAASVMSRLSLHFGGQFSMIDKGAAGFVEICIDQGGNFWIGGPV